MGRTRDLRGDGTVQCSSLSKDGSRQCFRFSFLTSASAPKLPEDGPWLVARSSIPLMPVPVSVGLWRLSLGNTLSSLAMLETTRCFLPGKAVEVVSKYEAIGSRSSVNDEATGR